MRKLVLLGGGDMREKTTLKIDEFIANLAKEHANGKRPYGLFIGTASHDCMPAFNTFRKTFTSVFDIKADCLLTVQVETPDEKIDEKLEKADFIYVGGGDTLYMLKKWEERGLTQKILSAYKRGVTLCGRSAGAICWFEQMYTDSEMITGKSEFYKLYSGLGLVKGTMTPHYNMRKPDFLETVKENGIVNAYAVEDNSALYFENEEFVKSLSSGGKSYLVSNINGEIDEKEI